MRIQNFKEKYKIYDQETVFTQNVYKRGLLTIVSVSRLSVEYKQNMYYRFPRSI